MAPANIKIRSPDGRLALEFNETGETLRYYEELPDGGTIDYFHRPQGNRNPMMHPWCNRVKGGVFDFNDEQHILRPLHGEENNALHGNWLLPWSVEDRGENHVILGISCKAEDGSSDPVRRTPYEYEARQVITLDNDGLNVDMTIVNRGRTLPFGGGLHPFIARPQDTILKVGAVRMENCGADMIPDSAVPVVPVPDEWTLNEGFNISNENLSPARYGFRNEDLMDNCFTEIDPGEGATITWPGFGGDGRRMTITASANCRFGVCFVPGAKNDVPLGEMSFFCFELTTNGINMQNRPAEAGAVILGCGEQLTASTKFSISKL